MSIRPQAADVSSGTCHVGLSSRLPLLATLAKWELLSLSQESMRLLDLKVLIFCASGRLSFFSRRLSRCASAGGEGRGLSFCSCTCYVWSDPRKITASLSWRAHLISKSQKTAFGRNQFPETTMPPASHTRSGNHQASEHRARVQHSEASRFPGLGERWCLRRAGRGGSRGRQASEGHQHHPALLSSQFLPLTEQTHPEALESGCLQGALGCAGRHAGG